MYCPFLIPSYFFKIISGNIFQNRVESNSIFDTKTYNVPPKLGNVLPKLTFSSIILHLERLVEIIRGLGRWKT